MRTLGNGRQIRNPRKPAGPKVPKPDTSEAQKILRAAIEPQRAGYTKAVFDYLLAQVDRTVKRLAEAGWDAQVAAPYPKSNMGRNEYVMLVKRYNDTRKWSAEPPLPEGQMYRSRQHNDPEPRVALADAVIEERLMKQANEITDHDFSSYTHKLAGKILSKSVSPIVAGSVKGALWMSSTLEVTLQDGSQQLWSTQMIINTSVLGNLFNQWPTRFVG